MAWMIIGYSFVSGMLSGLLLAIVASLYLRVRHQCPKNASNNLVEIERRRIARELHDTVGHGLLVIAMHARRLGITSPSTRATANAIDQVVQCTLRDVRTVIGALRGRGPGLARRETTRVPLSVRVAELIEELPPDTLRVEQRVVGVERELPPEAEQAAIRLVQEGLTNTIKYGGGRAVRVVLEFGTALTIAVETVGGPGRLAGQVAAGGTGWGLSGLRERMDELGGALRWRPRPKGGFEVVAQLPTGRPPAVMERGERSG